MQTSQIRVIALAIIQRASDQALLAQQYEDPLRQSVFYRPPGGGVEFHEQSADAVRREMQEEFGVAVEVIQLLGVCENIFFYQVQPRHEIVFLWKTRFVDPQLEQQTEFILNENGERAFAYWVQPTELASRGIPLYPDDLAELLAVGRNT